LSKSLLHRCRRRRCCCCCCWCRRRPLIFFTAYRDNARRPSGGGSGGARELWSNFRERQHVLCTYSWYLPISAIVNHHRLRRGVLTFPEWSIYVPVPGGRVDETGIIVSFSFSRDKPPVVSTSPPTNSEYRPFTLLLQFRVRLRRAAKFGPCTRRVR
jgi:hypothetical protein